MGIKAITKFIQQASCRMSSVERVLWVKRITHKVIHYGNMTELKLIFLRAFKKF